MTALNRSTQRRLQQLKQIPSVWEGDRRALANAPLGMLDMEGRTGDCILWVDGSHGVVRAMDMVPLETGSEAIVRTLLRAMEQPHSPARPARPQKIVVRDREIQFFLRGVLQDLGITIDYAPELPLIDEIFRSFQESVEARPPRLPAQYADELHRKAIQLWILAPWDYLAEHQIISIELNRWDIEKLYVSVMGMLGMEYGLLMYRSLDSLRQFRLQVLDEGSMDEMEDAFLRQDCLFLTYERGDEDNEEEDEDDEPIADSLEDLGPSQIETAFGNLHPLEGLRSHLHEDEALAMLVALESLSRFFKQHQFKFTQDEFPPQSTRYRIPLPDSEESAKAEISVQVATMPDLALELLELEAEDDDDDGDEEPILHDDLIPVGAYLSLGVVPWESVNFLRLNATVYQAAAIDIPIKGDGLPVVLVQTSLPKARLVINALQDAGGLQGVCFNTGEDTLAEELYDLGILQTQDQELHLFGEFLQQDPAHRAARKKWDRRCKQTKGYCGLVVAKGLTGSAKGNPQLKDMLALFEARFLSEEELGIGPLQMQAEAEWI